MSDNASIIKIPVDAREFENFAKKFDMYRDAVRQLPQAYQGATSALNQLASQIEKMESESGVRDRRSPETQESESKERFRRLQQSESIWRSMASSSTSMARDTLTVGTELLKWGAMFSGAALFGSAFGIDRLAQSMGDTRSTAMGFGVRPGALQAFSVNFSKVMDTQGFLSSMTEMESDVTRRAPWWSLMHGQPMSGDTTKDSMSMLNAIRDFAKREPEGLLGPMAQAYHLPLDTESLMRLRGTGDKEWASMLAGMQRDQRSFGLSDSGTRAWQNLQLQIERTGTLLKDKFAIALEPLAPELVAMSGAVGGLIAAFLKAPIVSGAIDSLTQWIDGVTKATKTDDFAKQVKTFTTDVATIVSGLHTIAEWMGKIGVGGTIAGVAGGRVGGLIGGAAGGLPGRLVGTAVGAGVAVGGYELYKHTDARTHAAALDGFLLGGPMGAMENIGIVEGQKLAAGWLPQLRGIGADFSALWREAQQSDLQFRERAIANQTMGGSAFSALLKAHPRDWKAYSPPEVRQQLQTLDSAMTTSAPQGTGVTVLVINATGGNAAVALNQLGSVP